MTVLLGLDIGTTSTVGILIDADGASLATVSRPSELVSLHANWAEEDPELWWLNVRSITAELLREARVVGVGALAVGQPLGVHARLHLAPHGVGVEVAVAIHLLDGAALGRGLGVQRKMHQRDLDVVFPLQLFNSHGAEIAPGSDVVREDLVADGLGHLGPP